MFKVIRIAIKFYEELFGLPFPFSKYDSVFVPDHQYLAMENASCITLSEEKFLFKDRPPSKHQQANFIVTVMHELSHMWFGNLVTMIWWDELWLNESFATYMSFEALS